MNSKGFFHDLINQFLGRSKRNNEVFLSLEGIMAILVYLALGWIVGVIIAGRLKTDYKFVTMTPAPILGIRQLLGKSECLFISKSAYKTAQTA